MRILILSAAVALLALPGAATAQTRPGGQPPRRPAPARPVPAYPSGIQVRGFGTVAVDWFTASSTFNAVLGSARGTEFGGGLSLTEGPGFIDIGARRFTKDGERVFVGNLGTVFPLDIPTTITMTPLDVTIGWRLRPLMGRRLRPYVGGGYTRLTYEETAGFAQDGDDVSESFNGYHVLGGGEFRFGRLVGVAAELAWTSIANAIGEGGASKAFDETNLGGTSARFKIVIGR